MEQGQRLGPHQNTRKHCANGAWVHLLDTAATCRYFAKAKGTLRDGMFALLAYGPAGLGIFDKESGGHCG